MQILFTKDGSSIGNAIIIREIPMHEVAGIATSLANYLTSTNQVLYEIETDFGNRTRLSTNEINEMFLYGPSCDYSEWVQDRANLRDKNAVRSPA